MSKMIKLSPQNAEATSAQQPVNRTRAFEVLKRQTNDVDNRLTQAELKITPEAITSVVTNASLTEPTVKYTGMLWLDTSVSPNELKRWDGLQWVNTSVTELTELGGEPAIYKATTPPSLPVEGTLWLDTSVVPNILKRYTGGTWVSANFTQSQIEQTATAISSSVVASYAYSKGEVDTTLTDYSTLTQTANSIALEIGKVVVGTKNYIKNSTFANGFTNWILSGAGNSIDNTDGVADGNSAKIVGAFGTTSYIRSYFEPKDITPGQKVAVSCMVKNDSIVYGPTNPFVRLYTVFEYTDLTLEYPITAFVTEGTTGWRKISVILTTNASKTLKGVSVYGYGRDFTGTVWFEDFKFEVGTKVTDWSPAVGELFGAKYIFDANNATFLGGGLVIKNNAGNTVMTANTSGDIQVTGELMVGQTSVNAGLSGSGTASTSIRFWAGTSTPSTSADFYVRDDGYLKATKGAIGGWSIASTAITSPSGKLKLDATNNRLYLNTSAYLYAGTTTSRIYASGSLELSSGLVANGPSYIGGTYSTTAPTIITTAVVLQFASGGTQYLLTRDASGFVKAVTAYTP